MPLVNLVVAGLLVSGIATFAGTASAQDRAVTLNQYRPAETANDGFAISRPDDLGHMNLGAQLHLDYAMNPLVYEDSLGMANTERLKIVSNQLTAHLGFALGLFDRLVVFVGLPINLVLSGDEPRDSMGNPLTAVNGMRVGSADGTSIGDITFGARLRLVGEREDTFALALNVTGTAPLADAASNRTYAGDPGFTIVPELLAELRFKPVRIDLNLGLRFREQSFISNIAVDHELTFGLGLTFEVVKNTFDLHAELYGSSGFGNFFQRGATPIEWTIGFKAHPSCGWSLGLAGGTGFPTRGYGSPDLRLIAMVGYAPSICTDAPAAAEEADAIGDQDHDGILDNVDRCPTDAEDRDNFEDENGCPDPDNDGDTVLDPSDGAPNIPEDADGFQDQDGVPDPDNDADGVLDAADQCRDIAEDADNVQDEDGCPETDADADQILDADDHCPLTPGVNNARNPECSGCPALACIDASGTIRILERVEFATNKDIILTRSQRILDDVLNILNTNPQIRRVRIEGHTDDRGNDARNLDLSQRRAVSVVNYLVEHGVDSSRLEGQGFGETRPLVPNRSSRNRQLNRRVEFHITDPAPPATADDMTFVP